MSGAALERVFRAASGRIIGALAARFRDLALAEDAFAEACARALEDWPAREVPVDTAAWLYQVAVRIALDALRRRRTHTEYESLLSAGVDAQTDPDDDLSAIPDERLRLIFICCHPAVSLDARVALTLRLVCGISTLEIARAFLVPEATMAQRLTRAKGKISQAGVPFELPASTSWPERLQAVLATIEIAYAKAHEDAAAHGPHSHFSAEMLELSGTLAQLMPREPEPAALAAMIRYAEARRPARVDEAGVMVPLSEQDPQRWRRALIDEADGYLVRAMEEDSKAIRVVQAKIHAVWCARRSLEAPPPWIQVLSLYDELLCLREDPVVRLNRLVALAEVNGVDIALSQLEGMDPELLGEFAPFHAVRADLLRRAGHDDAARAAYDEALARISSTAERLWLTQQRRMVSDAGG